MNYQENQRIWAEELNLTQQDLDYIKQQLPDPKYLDFISNSIDQRLQDFRSEEHTSELQSH